MHRGRCPGLGDASGLLRRGRGAAAAPGGRPRGARRTTAAARRLDYSGKPLPGGLRTRGPAARHRGGRTGMEAFGQGLAPELFRAVKGPDFVSRLQGYLNILGPNRQTPVDAYHLIHRAILQRDAPQLFQRQQGRSVLNIDTGVLRAFSQTQVYQHGVRSLEAIVAMSLLAGRRHFERSCLPAEAQLNTTAAVRLPRT